MSKLKYILLPLMFISTMQAQVISESWKRTRKIDPHSLLTNKAMGVAIKGNMSPGFTGGLFGKYDIELSNGDKITIIGKGMTISGDYQIGRDVIPLTEQEAQTYLNLIPELLKMKSEKSWLDRATEQIKGVF